MPIFVLLCMYVSPLGVILRSIGFHMIDTGIHAYQPKGKGSSTVFLAVMFSVSSPLSGINNCWNLTWFNCSEI